MRVFVPFLLVLFVIAALLRVDFFFTIAYLLGLVYLIARLWTRRSIDHLQLRRTFTERAFSGDCVTVDVSLRNTDWLPAPWVELHESLPVDLTSPPFYHEVITLDPHARHRFQYVLHCRRRGYYQIGPLVVQTGDLLGIVAVAQKEAAAERMIVYPQIVPLQHLGLPTHSPLAVLPAPAPLFEDPTRVRGVRDYRRGDSLRRIHWTATARAGRLLVKQYQPAIARETAICLDLDRNDYGHRQRYTATELAIIVAASLANHIIVREGLPVGLMTEAWDPLLERRVRFSLPPRAEQAHLMGLLEVLARVQVAETTPFTDMLRQESLNLPWGATLAVITGRESEALFDHLFYLRRAGFAVSLILVQPTTPSQELQKRAGMFSVPIHRVWNVQDVRIWE